MNTKTEISKIVKERYSDIAEGKLMVDHGCCSNCGCSSTEVNEKVNIIMHESYSNIKGYQAEADLGLGCGIPTQFAGIKSGDTVVDLGSGAGNDCFIARAECGEQGWVIGIDFTDEMIKKARENLSKTAYKNVEFIKGDIEDIPLDNATADVVISNCVLNLVADKEQAFSEIYRILKNKGHFCVSDIVSKGELPESLKKDAEMYAGCVAGAIPFEEYLDIIQKRGFKNIQIHKLRQISLPEAVLDNIPETDERQSLIRGDTGLFSITISGYKN